MIAAIPGGSFGQGNLGVRNVFVLGQIEGHHLLEDEDRVELLRDLLPAASLHREMLRECVREVSSQLTMQQCRPLVKNPTLKLFNGLILPEFLIPLDVSIIVLLLLVIIIVVIITIVVSLIVVMAVVPVIRGWRLVVKGRGLGLR